MDILGTPQTSSHIPQTPIPNPHHYPLILIITISPILPSSSHLHSLTLIITTFPSSSHPCYLTLVIIISPSSSSYPHHHILLLILPSSSSSYLHRLTFNTIISPSLSHLIIISPSSSSFHPHHHLNQTCDSWCGQDKDLLHVLTLCPRHHLTCWRDQSGGELPSPPASGHHSAQRSCLYGTQVNSCKLLCGACDTL